MREGLVVMTVALPAPHTLLKGKVRPQKRPEAKILDSFLHYFNKC